MKKISLIIASFLILVSITNAQKTGKRAQKIEAQKIAFISNKLDLTPEEAQVFWPIYNQHNARETAIKDKYSVKSKVDLMSDDELDQLIKNSLIKESLVLDEKKAYVLELRKILPIRKIAILFRTERQFRKRILKEVKKRMNKKERKQKIEKR